MAERPPLDVGPEPEADDDAALSWEGDDELGRATSLTERRDGVSSLGVSANPAVGTVGHIETGEATSRDEDASPPLVARLVTVLFGAVFLAFTVGWIFVIQGVGGVLGAATGTGWVDFVARISQFLALIAAALWFVGTVHLTRDSRMRVRVGWLALGAGLLVPWPLLLGLVS